MILRLVLYIVAWGVAWGIAATFVPRVKALAQQPDRFRKWLAGTAIAATLLAVLPIYG